MPGLGGEQGVPAQIYSMQAPGLSLCSDQGVLRVKRYGRRSEEGLAAARTNTMLQSLAPSRVMLEGARSLPPVLSPLIAAAERGEPLEGVVSAIVRMFGFDSFVYGASLSVRPGQEAAGCILTHRTPRLGSPL